MRKTVQVSFQRLHSTLLSLGYKAIKTNEYRRGKFHVITQPRNGSVEFRIHVDQHYGPPLWSFRSRDNGSDIRQECENIVRAVSNVGSRQTSKQP